MWVAASCSQLSDLWRKQNCSCRGLQAACGAGGSAHGMPAGRMAPRLPSDAKGPSGISLRALCSGDPEISLRVLLAKQTLLSAQMPRWSRSARTPSAGTAQVGLAADAAILGRAGCRWKSKAEQQRVWSLEGRQECWNDYGVPCTERGCWLAPRRVGCCGQRPGGSARQERCREGAGFHFPAHESPPCAAAAGAAAGARGPSRPCGPVGGWRDAGSSPTLPASPIARKRCWGAGCSQSLAVSTPQSWI